MAHSASPNFPPLARAVVLSLTLALLAGCGGDSPEAMLASAKDYLNKKDPSAATIQLKNALAKQPAMAEARFLLGKILLDGGDAVAAEVELRKALEYQYPREQVAPVLARALLLQGHFKKLIDELAKASTSSAEGRADLLTSIGTGYIMEGKKAEGQAAFNEALVALPGYAPAQLALARLKTLDRDLPGATALIDDIIAKQPDNADAWQFRADLYRVAGDLQNALTAYQKAASIKPAALGAHAASIMILLREQKIDLAKTQFDAMQKAAPKHPLTLYMQGLIAYSRKDLPAVRSAMEALLKIQPDNPQGLQLAGIVAFESKADLQAQEYLTKALQKAPGLDYGRRVLVMSLLRSGQPAKALAALQPVLQDGETTPIWLSLAGEVHMQNGDVQKAESYFSRAAKADPKNRSAQTALALARMQMGRVDQAFDDLEQIAAADSGVSADLALISSSIQRKQFDKALKAIANFEKKQPDNPAAHNLRGAALLGKGDLAGARQSFETALAKNPAYLPAATSLARLDLAEKQPDKARQRFQNVLKVEPKNVQAILALVQLGASTGMTKEETVALIEQAIAAAPADPAPRIALIGHYLGIKDQGKALTATQNAMSVLPDRPDILDVAGRVFQLTGDINQALATYGKLTTLLPTAAHPYLRMAEIQAIAGNKAGARDSLNKGLALLPDSLAMQRALIMLDVDEKKFDAALAKARAIQKATPKDALGHILEGDIHVVQQNWKEAVASYRTGLKLTPSTQLAERAHAAMLRAGQSGEASSFAESWLKSQPKDNAFRLYLADSANRRKDFGAAAAIYRTMLAESPNNPALLNNLAWSLGQMGDAKAVGYAEQAYKRAPGQPEILDTLGMLLVEQGKEVERGLDLLAQAIKIAPQAAPIRLNYAKALIKAGKKGDAKRELETLAKLGDKFSAQAEVATLLKGL